MEKPVVGLSVIVLNEKERRVLLLESKENDLWVFPGREVEMFTYSEHCARAIIKKDLGLELQLLDNKPHEVIETISRKKNIHYYTGIIRARYTDLHHKQIRLDGKRYEGFQWCRWTPADLPKNSLSSIRKLIGDGYTPFY